MGPRILVLLLVAVIQVYNIPAVTDNNDLNVLNALKDAWQNYPPSWRGTDPCGSRWDGISCSDSRVISITLASVGLKGTLTGDILSLSELRILDLSFNKGLSGPLPLKIGNLQKLKNLILVGCSFNGHIPDSIGSLPQLTYLSLNYNGFTGSISPSIGNLSNLYWLDLTDNQLTGTIPVSSGTTPGLDLLINTIHFHCGKNQLSGTIPEKLFSSQMQLIHVLFDSNKLEGGIPSSLGLVQTLEVVKLDNNSLTGPVPTNLNNLTEVSQLFLSNNLLTGPLPNLTGMNVLNCLDLSNNSFDATDFPPSLLTLESLTTLMMEDTRLQGPIPTNLFSLSHLQTVNLSNNQLNGTLDIGANFGRQLRSIDLQNNQISEYLQGPGSNQVDVILVDNPVCQGTGVTASYCTPYKSNSSYSTPPNNCVPASCFANQISSPKCKCAFPYTGILKFIAPSFSKFGNETYFAVLAKALMDSFTLHQLPVDSVSLSQPKKDLSQHPYLNLQVFPSGQDRFNRTGISSIGFVLNNQTFKAPKPFGTFVFHGDPYQNFAGESTSSKKSTSTGVIIGTSVGGSVVLLLLLLAGLYAYRQMTRAERATEKSNPFAHWDSGNKSIGGVPQLKGARCFSLEELRKYTNNFSEANGIGSGGYGKVYRGVLLDGQIIAIKRAKQGSMQGGVEFKNEIELLSRVHHKNVVSLLGFCFEGGEQMLIYEFVPNGSLMDSLSGKTGIRLDWVRRLKIALGSARGLAYLHELASPPIIHRDIKSTNILLDERLNAKVSDFGLSKPVGDNDKTYVTTQVKGTMGYLDPEYYMTQQLTEKSDVYSFGVLMLELVTGRRPLERGKYIVREVNMALDRAKPFYNLHELIDPRIGLEATLKGLDKFVDLALRCVQDTETERPTMGEVVKEIESILQLAGLNPNADSETSSSSYDDAGKGSDNHPYMFIKEAFDYSGGFPS